MYPQGMVLASRWAFSLLLTCRMLLWAGLALRILWGITNLLCPSTAWWRPMRRISWKPTIRQTAMRLLHSHILTAIYTALCPVSIPSTQAGRSGSSSSIRNGWKMWTKKSPGHWMNSMMCSRHLRKWMLTGTGTLMMRFPWAIARTISRHAWSSLWVPLVSMIIFG